VLSRFFHAWERRLASETTNRVVRPFEWGLDWIPGNGQPTDASPLTRLQAFADNALADSESFFSPPPTGDYELSEDGVLRFPSALTTPHPENNLVHARVFRAHPRSRWTAARSRRAVLVLPQWNSDAEGHLGLCRLLARCDLDAVRLSLPYHDERMPPELHRADYIVSANVGRTLQVVRQAVLDARRAIDWLERSGYERIGILGTSLGSCLAMLTAAHDARIGAAALNHISPYFADVVWNGLSTSHVRQGLEEHIDLEALRRLWAPISPHCHLDRMRNTPALLVYAKYDLTFPVDLSMALVEDWRRRGLPCEVAQLPCGHYSTGATPFKWIDGYLLTTFLRRRL
jgi:hypothetical protein